MSLLLHLETSSDICSIALSKDGELIHMIEAEEKNIHSEKLTAFIATLFIEQNYNIQDLDAVAVSSGPGSYTGLRIGVAVAKGICYGLGIPLIGVNTLDSFARAASVEIKADYYIPFIDAKNGENYFAVYDHQLILLVDYSIKTITPSDFNAYLGSECCFIGSKKNRDVADVHGKHLFYESSHSATHLVTLAEKKFRERQFEELGSFEPLYLRDFIAKKYSSKIRDILKTK